MRTSSQPRGITEKPEEASGPRASLSPMRKLPGALIVATYLLLGLVAYWSSAGSGNRRLFGTTSDSILATWFLGWVPHAASHAANPFFSSAMFAPSGVNLAQNTEAPLLGALSIPMAIFTGPIERANVLMLLAMPLSASSAYYVLRKWDVWIPAAGLGGLTYGFSPYMVGQGLGHLVLVFNPLLPLIALVLVRCVESPGHDLALGARLGLLMSAQFLCEPEVFAMITLVAAMVILVFLFSRRAERPNVVERLARRGGIAIVLTGGILAYPVWMILAGPQHYNGAAQGVDNPYYNDLLSFVSPGPLQRVGLGLPHLLAGNAFETGGFLGVPLILAAAVCAWRSRHQARSQLALVGACTSAVLSLGPHLSVAGHHTTFPLPFVLLSHLPLLDNILPVRFSLITAAALAALVVFGLDDVRRGRAPRTASGTQRAHFGRLGVGPRQARLGAILLLGALLVTQLPHWPYASQAAVTLPEGLLRAVPPGDPVSLTYPYAQQYTADALTWQLTSDYRFRLLGGYAEHPGSVGGFYVFPARMHPDLLQRFLANQEGFRAYGPAPPLDSSLVASTQSTLVLYRVRLVVVDRSAPGSSAVIELFSSTLGPPQETSGHFSLWASTRAPL